MPNPIFPRQLLSPSQIRTVSDWRLADATYLSGSRKNNYSNGVIYLAGFVLECLLKALLIEKHAWLQAQREFPHKDRKRQHLWSLVYRSHDLVDILEQLPELSAALGGANRPVYDKLQVLSLSWTVFARYSPKRTTMSEADDFLSQLNEVRRWLRQRQYRDLLAKK